MGGWSVKQDAAAAGTMATAGIVASGGTGGSSGRSIGGSGSGGAPNAPAAGAIATGGGGRRLGGLSARSLGGTASGGVPDAGAAGTIGTAGIVASGGTGGSSGGSTGGADAGGSTTAGCEELSDCPPTKVCNSASCVAPQGVVVLSVPLTTGGQNQRYAYPFSPAANLTDKTITLRVYAPGATAGLLNIYLSMANATSTAGSGALAPLVNYSSAWKDITFNVGGVVESFDPSQIKQITVEVQSHDLGTWKNPTVIYIDSIVISTLTLGSTFDSSLGGFSQSSTQAVPGSTLTWSSALP